MTKKVRNNVQVIRRAIRSMSFYNLTTKDGKPAWSVNIKFEKKHFSWNRYVTSKEELEIYRNARGKQLHVEIYTCEYKENPNHRRFQLVDIANPYGLETPDEIPNKEEPKPEIAESAIDGPLRSSLMAAAVAAEKEIERLKVFETKYNHLVSLFKSESKRLEEEFSYPE